MPLLPTLTETAQTRSVTDVFAGYNHNLKIADGEFFDTKNLSSAYYPLLSTRAKRGLVHEFTAYQGITALAGKLAYVDNNVLYYDGVPTGLTGITSGIKQLVTTGSYICIFPDGLYYNTVDPTDMGSMAATYELENVNLTYKMSNADGVDYNEAAKSDTAPEDPQDGDLWIDTKYSVLKEYSSSMVTWVEIPSVYTRIIFPAQTAGHRLTDFFSVGDGITISGTPYDKLNASKIISSMDETWITVVGILDNESSARADKVTIERIVPKMDFVIECQNRLWGCYYGLDDKSGSTINEIYATALGDFKNWYKYQGISTDSYAASVGTDGPWAAAINYLGYPTFFKLNHIHRVAVSAEGAHQISDTPCRGVPIGSAKSLAIINETLYYKGFEDVCVYQGGFPSTISSKLGDVKYHDAVGGALGDKYYLSMKDTKGVSHLFVADTTNGIWIREDNLNVSDFVTVGNEIYAVADGILYAIKGSEGTLEVPLDWYAETGMLYYELPDKKYVSRFNLRMKMEKGDWLSIFIEYDTDGVWREQGKRIYFNGTGTVTVPIKPRRCDHLRIRLVGHGDIKLYSIARILEQGSDY